MAARRGGVDDLRLFFALSVPGEQTRVIDKSLQPIRVALPDIRWIPRENWHLTLCFLGEVDEGGLDQMVTIGQRAAESISAPRLSFEGFGAFPSVRRARVLWVGVNDEDERTAKLAASLGTLASESGLREQRRFKAHLTVGRLKEPQDLSQPLADAEVRTTPFVCQRLTLFRSKLSPQGSTYEVLEEWPFGD